MAPPPKPGPDDAGTSADRLHQKLQAAETQQIEDRNRIDLLMTEIDTLNAERLALSKQVTDLTLEKNEHIKAFQALRDAFADLTRRYDTLEQDVNARAFQTVKDLERSEARQRTLADKANADLEQIRNRSATP